MTITGHLALTEGFCLVFNGAHQHILNGGHRQLRLIGREQDPKRENQVAVTISVSETGTPGSLLIEFI
jgi:hypothetical protein